MSDNKINLLIITGASISGIGGSENHIRSMIRWLPPEKYNIFVAQLAISISKNLEQVHHELFFSEHLHIFHFPLVRIYGLSCLQVWWALVRILRKFDIHCSISFHEKADIINALLPGNIVRISSRRDMAINPSSLLLWLRKITVRRFDAVTAPCKAILDFATTQENLGSVRQAVIHNGLDINYFSPAAPPATDIMQLKKDFIVGVSVGNFKEIKGYSYLVRAFAIIVARFHKARLLLVGADRGSLGAVKMLVGNLSLEKNILLLGARSDIRNILPACDYIVSSSLSEGLSNSLIEGIAAGLPAVATDVGGSNEIVQEGVNGFLVPPRDSEALAEAISMFYKNHQISEQMSLQSRMIAIEKFDIKKNILKYDRLISELMTPCREIR